MYERIHRPYIKIFSHSTNESKVEKSALAHTIDLRNHRKGTIKQRRIHKLRGMTLRDSVE
jgi:hypothetical protein